MEILNAICNIKRLDKTTMTNAIPDLIKPSYQRNTISGICVCHTVLMSQEFYHIAVFHPGRYKAESDFQYVLQKVDTVKG
jgi:hypothetical protein